MIWHRHIFCPQEKVRVSLVISALYLGHVRHITNRSNPSQRGRDVTSYDRRPSASRSSSRRSTSERRLSHLPTDSSLEPSQRRGQHINAQQQALEQFQCQLQLAQQTEAINQRLDAIERTLNTLIQQRAQDEAAKNAAVAAAAAAVVNTPVPPTQLRPSQQLQLPGSPPGGEGKKKGDLLCINNLLLEQ